MANKRVKDRSDSARHGYAKGGSAERSQKIGERTRSTVGVILISVIVCAAFIGIVTLFIKLTLKDFSKDEPKNVTVYYGELSIRTERKTVYDGANVRVDMNCVRDMLSLTMTRDGKRITYSTKSGDKIEITVGESTATVNGILFSLPTETLDVKGKIFASADVVNRFISDTTVAVEEKTGTVSVITLVTSPDDVFFTPKKSEEMDGMNRPSSIPRDTSYNPAGTAPQMP